MNTATTRNRHRHGARTAIAAIAITAFATITTGCGTEIAAAPQQINQSDTNDSDTSYPFDGRENRNDRNKGPATGGHPAD